jgi:hypothetical protein
LPNIILYIIPQYSYHSVYNTAVFENTAVFFQNCEKTSLPNTL